MYFLIMSLMCFRSVLLCCFIFQPLANLKKMDLSRSLSLRELPDLSNALMLEKLELCGCESLVEIHSSIGNLRKIDELDMSDCTNLQVVPDLNNLTPLAHVGMNGCSQLTIFPDISTEIRALAIADTMMEALPKSVRHWSGLRNLTIYGVTANIEQIPDCIKDLHELESLWVFKCSKLTSLPELPSSLERVIAESCESLKTVLPAFDSDLIQQSLWASLPGRKIPEEFDHRAIGNSLTVRSDSRKFRFCIVVSPKQPIREHYPEFFCRMRVNKGCPTDHDIDMHLQCIQAEHLCFSFTDLADAHGWLDQENEIVFEFIACQKLDIIECGVQIVTEESERRRRIEFDEASKDSQRSTYGLTNLRDKEENNG